MLLRLPGCLTDGENGKNSMRLLLLAENTNDKMQTLKNIRKIALTKAIYRV